MLIDHDAIQRAFQSNYDIYVDERHWAIEDIAKLWGHGLRAFSGDGDEKEFHKLYENLKSGWQVFRGSKPPEHDWVYRTMMGLDKDDPPLRELRLSELSAEHLPKLEKILEGASNIKTLKSGRPSLVAVTKFLHFWNPRLFVIVDGDVMDNYVLRHRWIGREVNRVRQECQPELCVLETSHGLSYIGLLLWGSQVMRQNPKIQASFANQVKAVSGLDPDLQGFEYFEGAAFEWLLRGLVDLPPVGVHVT
jgi:hypothetical protein